MRCDPDQWLAKGSDREMCCSHSRYSHILPRTRSPRKNEILINVAFLLFLLLFTAGSSISIPYPLSIMHLSVSYTQLHTSRPIRTDFIRLRRALGSLRSSALEKQTEMCQNRAESKPRT